MTPQTQRDAQRPGDARRASEQSRPRASHDRPRARIASPSAVERAGGSQRAGVHQFLEKDVARRKRIDLRRRRQSCEASVESYAVRERNRHPSNSVLPTPERGRRHCREGGGSGPGCDDSQRMSPFPKVFPMETSGNMIFPCRGYRAYLKT